MKTDDKPRFATILTGVADYYGKELSAGVIGLYWQGLLQYDLTAVERALWLHTQNPDTGRFMPKIADLIGVITGQSGGDGRPNADEAWAIALVAEDEFETLVWNNEISQAWGIAKEVMPDRVGARMAFRSAYDRFVTENRVAGIKPNWFASLGWDKERRVAALERAVSMNRLSAEHAQKLLPYEEPKEEMLALASNVIPLNRGVEDWLQTLKALTAEPTEDGSTIAEIKALETKQKKDEIARQIHEYQQRKPKA